MGWLVGLGEGVVTGGEGWDVACGVMANTVESSPGASVPAISSSLFSLED